MDIGGKEARISPIGIGTELEVEGESGQPP